MQCDNEIKSLRSKLALNNGNDDENEEMGEGELESDENDNDDDDEPTLMSRSKHCAKQVYLIVSSFEIQPEELTVHCIVL